MVNRPRQHPTPVLVSDQPWEGERAQAWGSVIAEPDVSELRGKTVKLHFEIQGAALYAYRFVPPPARQP